MSIKSFYFIFLAVTIAVFPYRVSGKDGSVYLWVQVHQIDNHVSVSLNGFLEGFPNVKQYLRQVIVEKGKSEPIRIAADDGITVGDLLQVYLEVKSLGFNNIEVMIETVNNHGGRMLRGVTFGEESELPRPDSTMQIPMPGASDQPK